MDWSRIWGGAPGLIEYRTGIIPASLLGPAPEFAFWSHLIKVLVCLSVLLGVLLLVAFLWKRWGGPRQGGASPLIRVMATHYLAPKKALILVGVGEERLLLASAGDQLSLITGLATQKEVTSPPPVLAAIRPPQ